MQATLTEGIAGIRVRIMTETQETKINFPTQVTNERLGMAAADHRFRYNMAKIAAACGMDRLGSSSDDTTHEERI
jgi:hypothetical protein